MKERPLDTIYFGGGTPTSLPAEDIDAILCKLEQLFDTKKCSGIYCRSRPSGQHYRRKG